MVFNSLKKLFGGDGTKAKTQETRAAPAPAASSAASAVAPPEITGFLYSEAVFDRQNRLAGHYFHLQLPEGEQATFQAIDQALLDTVLSAGPLGTGRIFLPLHSGSLDLPAVDRLPSENLILLIDLDSETGIDQLLPRFNALRERGFKIGLFREPKHPAFAPLMAQADMAAIDDTLTDPGNIRDFSAALRGERGSRPARLFALNINTPDEHQLYYQWHYDYFHGRFASHEAPPRPAKPGGDPHKVLLLKLLRLVQGDAETAEIAEAMKLDPLLAFRILRYLNSPALGLTHPVDSLSQALIILGRQRLARWLAVLIFSVKDPNFADWMLVESALTRGRLMELLGARLMPGKPGDPLFLTGLFSRLDRLLHQPMPEALGDMPLAEGVRSALIDRAGPYAPLLKLAEACESFDTTKIAAAAEAIGLEADQVNHALLNATSWACEMTEHWE